MADGISVECCVCKRENREIAMMDLPCLGGDCQTEDPCVTCDDFGTSIIQYSWPDIDIEQDGGSIGDFCERSIDTPHKGQAIWTSMTAQKTLKEHQYEAAWTALSKHNEVPSGVCKSCLFTKKRPPAHKRPSKITKKAKTKRSVEKEMERAAKMLREGELLDKLRKKDMKLKAEQERAAREAKELGGAAAAASRQLERRLEAAREAEAVMAIAVAAVVPTAAEEADILKVIMTLCGNKKRCGPQHILTQLKKLSASRWRHVAHKSALDAMYLSKMQARGLIKFRGRKTGNWVLA